MSLPSCIDCFKLVDFHVECFLVLSSVFHLGHKLGALFVILIDLLKHLLNVLVFIEVLWLGYLLVEFVSGFEQFGNLFVDLFLHVLFALISLLSRLTQFM